MFICVQKTMKKGQCGRTSVELKLTVPAARNRDSSRQTAGGCHRGWMASCTGPSGGVAAGGERARRASPGPREARGVSPGSAGSVARLLRRSSSPAARPAARLRPLLLNPRGEAAAAAARRAGAGEERRARRGGRGGAGACSGAERSPSPDRALTPSVRLLVPREPGLAGARAVAARGAPRAGWSGADGTGPERRRGRRSNSDGRREPRPPGPSCPGQLRESGEYENPTLGGSPRSGGGSGDGSHLSPGRRDDPSRSGEGKKRPL